MDKIEAVKEVVEVVEPVAEEVVEQTSGIDTKTVLIIGGTAGGTILACVGYKKWIKPTVDNGVENFKKWQGKRKLEKADKKAKKEAAKAEKTEAKK